ncbi:MAG: outer membrane protein assembly factor BamB [Xanthomonadales bacterium]|nr:outer membrane protein assembly factor BamB [Xanthomonadales bacterium]
MRRLALIVAASALALGGCKWFQNLGRKDNVEPPTPLATFAPTASVQQLWTASAGKGAGTSGARMRPAVHDGRLYVAGVDGSVLALDAGSGRTLWTVRDKQQRWSGGPAASDDLVVVGSLDGSVQAFSAADGSPRWSSRLDAEVITAPAIGTGLIAVRAQNGRLFGLDPADGARKWVYEQAVPVLSLRGNSPPVIEGDLVYNGYDSGRVVAVRSSDGALAWTQMLAAAEGKTEVERLSDVDGELVVDAGEVIAASYRGQLAAFNADSGRPAWGRDMSSYAGVAVNARAVVVTDAEGNVWAFDRQGGANLWKQDGLLHRWLGAPAIVGNHAVVGDLEGYVHWLDLDTGAFAARERLSKKPIESAPVVAGDVVYVEDVEGRIGAWRSP